MMTFTFDELKLARERGYSDDEIWNTLSTEDKEIGLAKERGYSLEEVASITSGQPTPTAEPEPERRAGGGITGGAADVGVQFMKGLGTGTRMISDVFGANNPVSKSIAGYEDYMDSLLSAESKKDSQEISRILKDAEGKGILPQIMAGLEAFTVAPAEMTATTMGMMLPNLAGGVYAKAAQLTKAGVIGLQMGIGAAQGAGSVKGQIYTAVQEELRQQGLPEDQIDKVATEAQAYNGKNLDQILIGAGLGAAASSTGAEKIMTRLITGAGKEATEGLIKSTIKGGLAEAPIEALQGGQEKVAENVALQRIGVDVPTMQGVIPAATMEATAGLLIGGGLGGVEAFVSPEKREETDIDKQAQQTANEFLAPNDPTSQAMVKELARRENAVKNLQEAYDVLEPTSQEAQRLKLELSDAQRKLSAYKEIANKAGLSLPITTAEQQKIEEKPTGITEPTIEITQEQIDKATQDFTATPEGARAILENKPFEASQSKSLPEGWFNETYGGTIFSIPPSIVKTRLPAQAELRNLSILERAALTGKLTKEKIVNEIDAKTYIEDAAKQGFTTEQIDAAAPEAEAKWNERFGEGGIARKVAGDVSPPIVDFAAEEAARARKPKVTGGNALPANKLFGKTAREALQYLADQNLGASELEREGRPLNISQIMQRAASVIAKLPLRILDADFIKSAAGGNRAYRHSQGFIRIPATSRGRTYFERPETLVHEVGHTLTADAIRKYVFAGIKTGQSGDRYLMAMNIALDDSDTPEQIKKLISLYKKTIAELGLTNDYFGANGLASTDATSSQKKAFSRKKPLINKFTGKKIGWSELYALANLDEFVAQAWSSPAFQDLLKSIKVKNEPSIFEQFVRIIRDLFGFESDTMAAAVIDASFALAELEAPATRGTVEERIAANIAREKGKKAPKAPTPEEPAPTSKEELTVPATPKEKITDPATPDEQTQQLVQQAQEQESIVDAAVKEAGDDVFNVFNKLVNEGKTEDQVAKELGISNYDVRKYKLRADTAILNKMKQNKVKPLAFAPKNPVAEFAEKNLRKYFTKEGWLPKAVFQSWVKRNAALSREQKEAEFAIKDLYAGIREVFGISKMEMITKGLVSVPPEFVQQLNDALAGKIDINTMPEPVREPLTRMRQHIDAMSRKLVDLNVLPDELAAKISENLGVYLTRSYKIFTDKNWINKIPTEKLTAARNFLYQQQLKNDPEATIEMADRELRNMLNDWASDAEGLRKRGGKLGAKDLSVMMERAKVPKVLREVMGENTNVIFNYANTIGKISRFVSDQKFLNEVKAKGTGEFLFTEKDAPKGFNTQIAAEESRTMSPLNGLRTTPEIAKAFEEFGKGYDIRENPGLRLLAWMNAVGKLNLTVGSVLTQMRNMLGQPAFFVFNGHYNWRVIRQEIDAIAKEKGISQEDAKRELVKLAAAQGLVNENAYAGELRTAFQDVGLETFDDIGPDEFTKQFVLTRMYLKGVKSAQELYQKTDEFGKIVGWLNETKRIQRMNKGMDKQTAQSIAAERTRDTYPTYSQSSEALRLFRRQPFVGPFATFFYETFRTSFHNLRYAFEDINGPTPEHKAEGIKRLAGAMTTLSMGAFGINLLSKLASGIGDDEEEDVRRMLPPWAKDASLAWMPKSKDGTYNFINVSYINPYNAMTDPFIAMMSGFAKGDKPEEIAVQALGSFLSPFTSEQPVTATIGDAARNRTSTGKQIYNPQDDITTKTSKIMLHIFGKTFTPGTITRLRERIIPAIQGETVGTRAPAPAKEIAAELTGIRFETLDMKSAFSSKAWEFSRAANESERIFRDVATRRRRVDEQEQVDAYRRSEQTRYEIWNDMYRDYMAVRRAGASQGEAVRLMTDIGISKKEAIAISKGRYVPYEVSNEVLRRSKLNENKVPIKEIRAIGKEMPRVLTDIKKTP